MQPPTFLSLCPPSIRLTKRSLTVTESATEEELAAVEAMLLDASDATPFLWGDYLNHLARTRGPEYAQAKALNQYAPGTSRNMQWVCRQVDVSRRRDTLTFGHHAEVSKLTPTEQELMLTRAEEEEWSIKELRAQVRKSKQTITDAENDGPLDARAAAGTRAWQEFAPWFQAQYPAMPAEQQAAWKETVWPLVTMMVATADRDEMDALVGARQIALEAMPA